MPRSVIARICSALVVVTLVLVAPVWAAFCTQCGKSVPEAAKFCPACGARQAGSGGASVTPAPAPGGNGNATALGRVLAGKRYIFAFIGSVNGREAGSADVEVATKRLEMKLESILREQLAASVFDSGALDSLRKSQEEMAVLMGGGIDEVGGILQKYGTDFLVRVAYRTAPAANIGGQYSATAMISADILSPAVAMKPFAVSTPPMGTDDHPAKMALGAFDAAMLALDYQAQQFGKSLQKALFPSATMVAPPQSAQTPVVNVTPLSASETANSLISGRKPRVAVTKFEQQAGADFGSWELPTGLADMLTTQLASSNRVKILERQELDAVMGEKTLQAATGARGAQGQVLGAEYLIKGTLTEFTYETQNTGGGLNIKGFSIGGRFQKAHIALDLRIIDAGTGEIIDSKRVEKKQVKKGLNLGVEIDDVKFGTDHWSKLPIGQVTREAIDEAANTIIGVIEKTGWSSVVVAQTPTGWLIRGGTDQGLRPGMVFKVMRKGQALIDPETGESLGSNDSYVGEVIVTQVKEKVSTVAVYKGGRPGRADRILLTDAAKTAFQAAPPTIQPGPVPELTPARGRSTMREQEPERRSRNVFPGED